MKSKYFFKDHKKLIDEEHKLFKTVQEKQELKKDRCDHKGKVSIVKNVLKCKCGAAWSGPEIETLYKLLTT